MQARPLRALKTAVTASFLPQLKLYDIINVELCSDGTRCNIRNLVSSTTQYAKMQNRETIAGLINYRCSTFWLCEHASPQIQPEPPNPCASIQFASSSGSAPLKKENTKPHHMRPGLTVVQLRHTITIDGLHAMMSPKYTVTGYYQLIQY